MSETRKILMACLSRGGSNLVAALLHNHPNIYSIAKREWKPVLSVGGVDKLMKRIHRSKKSIYFEGGFKKDLYNIKCLVLDKYLEKGRSCASNDVAVAVIRNPFAVINSMHQYGLKYKFKPWQHNKNSIDKLIKERFITLVRFAYSQSNIVPIIFDDVISDPNNTMKSIYDVCGVEPIPHDSFKNVFDNNGCIYCGGNFEIRKTDGTKASTVASSSGISYPTVDHFYCPGCKIFTIGYGNFNPCLEISKPKGWVGAMPECLIDATYRSISKYNKGVADKLLKDSITHSDLKELLNG